MAVVHLGNQGGLGTTRRVRVWTELLAAADADVVEVNLLRQHRRAAPSPAHVAAALRGVVVPETITWSPRAAARAIRSADADAAVFVTARAFHPRIAEAVGTAVLDFQDLFSRSYRGRALVDRRPGASTAWRLLAWATERFERRGRRVRAVTAGWSEARQIGATWLPNTISAAVPPGSITDHADAPTDVLFFGKLSALPNLDAIRQLADLWPLLASSVPDATCALAGAGANEEIARLAATHGWHVEHDFADVTQLCRRARLAVAPLRHANGIQNKVLEAAASGLPQVVSSMALRGMAPGFPAVVADGPDATVRAIDDLLGAPQRRLELACQAHDHVVTTYAPGRWVEPVGDLISSAW